jgi:SAM-dependent methyltransferase
VTRDSSPRYDAPGKAAEYAARSQERQAAEAELLDGLLNGLDCELGATLDVPCGAGRLAPLLQRHGAIWHGADRSAAMIEIASEIGEPLFQAAIDRLPVAARGFDTVVCFRLLHHFPRATQRDVVTELARVTNRLLIVSAFHPLSLHHLERRVVGALTRKQPSRFATPPATVEAWLRTAGFEPRARVRQGILRDLWIGAWTRNESS